MKEPQTANELKVYTRDVLNTIPGVEVWIQNNLAVKGRRFIGRRGVADVIGWDKNAVWIAIEVKAGDDKLSEDQKQFLSTINQNGGHAYVVTNPEDVEQIMQFLIDKR